MPERVGADEDADEDDGDDDDPQRFLHSVFHHTPALPLLQSA